MVAGVGAVREGLNRGGLGGRGAEILPPIFRRRGRARAISPARTRGEARRPPLPRPSQARELLAILAFPLGLV